MSALTLNTEVKTEGKTYRYKFSKAFLENLKEFTRIHKFDDPKIFKEHFDEWKDENKEVIGREELYMKNMGYEGDVISKMYKSARYYFKNKSNEKVKPKKRRQYIGIDITLDAYTQFIEKESNKIILTSEKARLKGFGLDEDGVNKKFKKTFKNRYFLKFK